MTAIEVTAKNATGLRIAAIARTGEQVTQSRIEFVGVPVRGFDALPELRAGQRVVAAERVRGEVAERPPCGVADPGRRRARRAAARHRPVGRSFRWPSVPPRRGRLLPKGRPGQWSRCGPFSDMMRDPWAASCLVITWLSTGLRRARGFYGPVTDLYAPVTRRGAGGAR